MTLPMNVLHFLGVRNASIKAMLPNRIVKHFPCRFLSYDSSQPPDSSSCDDESAGKSKVFYDIATGECLLCHVRCPQNLPEHLSETSHGAAIVLFRILLQHCQRNYEEWFLAEVEYNFRKAFPNSIFSRNASMGDIDSRAESLRAAIKFLKQCGVLDYSLRLLAVNEFQKAFMFSGTSQLDRFEWVGDVVSRRLYRKMTDATLFSYTGRGIGALLDYLQSNEGLQKTYSLLDLTSLILHGHKRDRDAPVKFPTGKLMADAVEALHGELTTYLYSTEMQPLHFSHLPSLLLEDRVLHTIACHVLHELVFMVLLLHLRSLMVKVQPFFRHYRSLCTASVSTVEKRLRILKPNIGAPQIVPVCKLLHRLAAACCEYRNATRTLLERSISWFYTLRRRTHLSLNGSPPDNTLDTLEDPIVRTAITQHRRLQNELSLLTPVADVAYALSMRSVPRKQGTNTRRFGESFEPLGWHQSFSVPHFIAVVFYNPATESNKSQPVYGIQKSSYRAVTDVIHSSPEFPIWRVIYRSHLVCHKRIYPLLVPSRYISTRRFSDFASEKADLYTRFEEIKGAGNNFPFRWACFQRRPCSARKFILNSMVPFTTCAANSHLLKLPHIDSISPLLRHRTVYGVSKNVD